MRRFSFLTACRNLPPYLLEFTKTKSLTERGGKPKPVIDTYACQSLRHTFSTPITTIVLYTDMRITFQ